MRRLSFLLAVTFLSSPLFAASNPVPTVNQPLVPSSVLPGSAAFTLKVEGSGFVSGAVVKWNGIALSTKFVNRSQLTVAVPKTRVANPGTVTVTVTNPAPGGGTSNSVFFSVTTPTPSLTFNTSNVTVGTSVTAVAVGDFNNDGKMDMAVANDSGTGCNYVSILLGNGDGTFNAGGNIILSCDSLAATGAGVTIGDFNHDGRLDVAAVLNTNDGPIVAVYLGNGDGTFASQPSAFLQGYDFIGAAIVGDFNSDGKLDLAFPADIFSQGGLYVFLGNGNGTFASSPLISGIAASSWLVQGDFNGDGILDVAGQLDSYQTVTILMGKGDGTFSPASSQPSITTPGPAVTGDFNGDGILDLAFPGPTVLLGNGDGTFTQKNAPPDAEPTNSLIAAADFNGDGKLDLAELSSNSILIYLGNGDGTFQTALEIPETSGALQLAVGDFNADGRLDLAVANSSESTVSVLLQSPTAVVSASTVKFGKQAVGTKSALRPVSLTNSGSAALKLSTFVASGDFSQTNNCKTVLPMGQTCTINIAFKPTATGLRTGSVTITDNAANSPQVIQLSGTGD